MVCDWTEEKIFIFFTMIVMQPNIKQASNTERSIKFTLKLRYKYFPNIFLEIFKYQNLLCLFIAALVQ
jgi:hypothetical protein